LWSYLKSGGIPPPPPTLRRLILATRFGVLVTQFGVSPCVRVAKSRRHAGGGVGGLFPNTQELVFWLFLLSYLTSGPFSCCYFLLLKQRFFWYYFSCQVMAILCCVAQKAASAAQGLGGWNKKKIFILFGPDTYNFIFASIYAVYAGNNFRLWVITQKKVVSDS
jgi:hypothetical protein